ncbi:MAG TPA: ABC transporter substrate-binding protein [Roseiarcus sp.]|jgi:peptide/nickel transport system substrate-binding protein
MPSSGKFLAAATAAFLAFTSLPASAAQILVLSEDVPAGLDSDGPSAAIPTSQSGMVNMLEPLVGYAAASVKEDGVIMPDFSKPVGLLAESWTYDPAALTWTFKLREGVKGCTGDTFTSADVIYTFARAKSVSGAAPIGWFLSNVASIKGFTTDVFGKDSKAKELGDGIVALDDYTVQIKQSQPNALLLPVLAIFGLQIFDKKIMEAHATAQDPWSHDYGNTVNAPGFGSYCLDSWQKGQSISYKANTNYYRGKPAIDKVVVRRVPESSNRVAVLRTGQAQLVTGLTPKEFDSLRSIAGITVEGVTGNQNLFEHMNFKSPPFDNPKVREAVSHAIPYDQIIATGYFGQATIWQGFVPSGYPGYVPSAKDFIYDPAKAKALLAEAGFPDGKGLEKFVDNLQLSYVSEKESTLGPIVNILQSSFRAIGIPVTLNPIPGTQYGDRQLVKGDLPFAVNDQEEPIGVDVGYAVQLFFVTKDKGGLYNMVNYSNSKVDDLWTKARVEPDANVRNQLLAEIQDQLAADVAWAPIVEYKTQWAMSSKLTGLRWYADNSIRFFDLTLR